MVDQAQPFTGSLLAMLLAALDSTIVATALPTIVAELGNVERLSWVVTSYLLAQTIVIPLYGKLGDLYGRRTVLQSAIVILGLAATAVAATIAFIAVEARAAEPMLPLRLFRERTFALASLVGFAVGFALFGSVTYLPMFLQLVKNGSPTRAGLEMTPMMIGTLITSIGSGQLISRYGRYRAFPIAGTAIAAVALVWMSRMTAAITVPDLMLRLFMLGTGLGMVTQVLVVAVQNTAPYEHLGVATAGATMFRLIGGSVGTAVMGSLFAAHVAALHDAPRALAITGGIDVVFRVAAGVAATGFVLTWFIPSRPLRETVAAATSSVGKDAGDAFAMPGTGDPSQELLRGVAILANRDAQRAYVHSITMRAGVDRQPVAAWVLLRLGEDGRLTPEAIAHEHGIEAQRMDEGMAELRARGLIATAPTAATIAVTEAGCDAYDRLAAARRERLRELSIDWPESQRQQLASLLQRLARELVPPRAA